MIRKTKKKIKSCLSFVKKGKFGFYKLVKMNLNRRICDGCRELSLRANSRNCTKSIYTATTK